jgi:hypothetical protein
MRLYRRIVKPLPLEMPTAGSDTRSWNLAATKMMQIVDEVHAEIGIASLCFSELIFKDAVEKRNRISSQLREIAQGGIGDATAASRLAISPSDARAGKLLEDSPVMKPVGSRPSRQRE